MGVLSFWCSRYLRLSFHYEQTKDYPVPCSNKRLPCSLFFTLNKLSLLLHQWHLLWSIDYISCKQCLLGCLLWPSGKKEKDITMSPQWKPASQLPLHLTFLARLIPAVYGACRARLLSKRLTASVILPRIHLLAVHVFLQPGSSQG